MKKIPIIIASIFVALIAYGLISWNVFKIPTVFSEKEDCGPIIVNGVYSDIKQMTFRIKYFGLKCVKN